MAEIGNTGGVEEIDVEALLGRAYREKRVHQLGGAHDGNSRRLLSRLIGLSAPALGGSGWSTNDVVDSSGFAANSVARVNDALLRLQLAPDALLDLHDVVLGLPDFYVERAGLDFLVWDHETAARHGEQISEGSLGPTIVKVRRRGGRRAGAEDLLPDGPRRRLVRVVTSALLVLHGANASRPEVAPVVVTGQRAIYRGAKHEAVDYEPEYETPLDEVALDRATYAAWHCALGMVREAAAHLPSYRVTGPVAPAEPWEAAPAHLLTSDRDPLAGLDLLGDQAPAKRPRGRPRKVAKEAA